jgi:hypothetical protein
MRTIIFLSTFILCDFFAAAQVVAPKKKKIPFQKPVSFSFNYYELYKEKDGLDTIRLWRDAKKQKLFRLPGKVIVNKSKEYVKVTLKGDSFEESHYIYSATPDCIKMINGWRWYTFKDDQSEGMACFLSDKNQWIVYRNGKQPL